MDICEVHATIIIDDLVYSGCLSWSTVEGCESRWLTSGLSVEDEALQLTADTRAGAKRRVRRALLTTNAYESLTPNNRTLCPETVVSVLPYIFIYLTPNVKLYCDLLFL